MDMPNINIAIKQINKFNKQMQRNKKIEEIEMERKTNKMSFRFPGFKNIFNIFNVLLIFSLILGLSGASAECLDANYSNANSRGISINKTADVSTAVIGDIINYNVTIRNEGYETLYNVTIRDYLPDGFVFVDGWVPGKYCIGDAGNFAVPLLNSSSSAYTATIEYIGNGTECGLVGILTNTTAYNLNAANTATVHGYTADNDSVAINSAIAVVNVFDDFPPPIPQIPLPEPPPPLPINILNISINKTADVYMAEIGDIITYNITIRNDGNETLYNVTINDYLPDGFIFVDGWVPGKYCMGDAGNFEVPVLNSSSTAYTANIDYIGSGTECGLIGILTNTTAYNLNAANTATVYGYSENNDPVAINSAIAIVNVFDELPPSIPTLPCPPQPPESVPPPPPPINILNISINKTADVYIAEISDIITYNITIRNDGNETLYNVTINDYLPDGFIFVDGWVPGKYCIGDTGNFAAPALNSSSPTYTATIEYIGSGTECGLIGILTNTTAYNLNAANTATVHGYDVNNYSVAINTAVATVDVFDELPPPIPQIDPPRPVPAPRLPPSRPTIYGISVNKTANVSTAEVSDVIEYKIVIKNAGIGALYDVDVEDTLPYGIRYVEGSKSIACTGYAVVVPPPPVPPPIPPLPPPSISPPIPPPVPPSIPGVSVLVTLPYGGAGVGAKIGAVIGAKIYPETRYDVYLKPALLNKNLMEIYQNPALWDERITEIYQNSALWDERITEMYQTPVLWNESSLTLFDIYGDLMSPEHLHLYKIKDMGYREVCTITYQAEVLLCHPNATNYANVTAKNSGGEILLNETDSAIVDIPCQLPDFAITNMSIPVIKEIKDVIIPYETNERNETLTFSALVFINKTQIENERKIYFDLEDLEHLPHINFDILNITLYDNEEYYDSITRNFTNIVRISNIGFNWIPATHGWHNLTIVIDPENVIQESDKSNNDMTLEIEVVLPDLTITNISMPVIKEIKEVTIPYGSNERNETLISSESVIANKTPIGKERIIYFDIKNLEEPPFPLLGNVTIAMYDNDNHYASITTNLTNVYEYYNLSMKWIPVTPGWHNLTIVIDPENVICKSNKSNNNVTFEIEVVLPDLAITNMSMPVIETIKDVVIPYGSDVRNEISNISRLVIANKTPLGENRIIYFDIENLEEPPFPGLSNVTIAMYDNGNHYASITKNLTNVYEYYNLSIEWVPLTPGRHNLTIVIDPENVIQESNKSNNNMTLEIEVVLPDLTITNMSMPIIKEVKKIKIPYNRSWIISSEFIIAHNTTINQERIIYANIKNLEEMQFSYLDNVSIILYDNDDYYASKLINVSNAFEFFNLDFNWTPAYTGVHNLTCFADLNDEINESDEENNNMSFAIDVLPVPAPDFTIINISDIILHGTCLVSSNLLTGKNSGIYIDIENLAEPPYLDIGNVNISLLIFDENNNLIYNGTKTRNLTNAWKILNLNFSMLPLNEGVYTVIAVIDSNKLINETNEFNNNFTTSIDVKYNDTNTCLTKSLKIDTGNYNFLKLDPGWNLISLPMQPENNSIDSVLKEIQGKWTDVAWYNNSWVHNSYAYGDWFGNLSTMEPGKGYWLWVNESVNLRVYGEQLPLNISLHTGWNLIGVTHALDVSELNLDYDKLVTYNSDLRASYRVKYNGIWFTRNLEQLEPGKGYWIHMLNDGILEV